MRWLIIVGFSLLSGCVASNGRLAAQLEHYHQRNVRDLFAVLGAPSAETAVDGQEVYVWGDARLALLPEIAAGADQNATSGATTPACTIRVFVNADERIASWDILGNETTCATYAQRLSAPH